VRKNTATAAFNLLFPITGIESISVGLLIADNTRLKWFIWKYKGT